MGWDDDVVDPCKRSPVYARNDDMIGAATPQSHSKLSPSSGQLTPYGDHH